MLRMVLAGVLLVILAITMPLTQAGSAAVFVVSPQEVRQEYNAALSTAGCRTLTEKTATRTDVALVAVAKATQEYATAHHIAVPDTDAFLQQPAARAEIIRTAANMYRRYLQYLGHRLVVAQSPGCTRAIVAFAGNDGALNIIAEERLKLAQAEGSGGVGGGPIGRGAWESIREALESAGFYERMLLGVAGVLGFAGALGCAPCGAAAIALGGAAAAEAAAAEAAERAVRDAANREGGGGR